MQTKAALMVLVLLSGTIAGCTSDPDGGGNDGIDSDALDELFDQYFEDFVNNTTITVNNHYYNNTTYVVDDGDYSTTVVNEYNNTTINEGDETSTNNYNNQTEYDYSAMNYTWGSGGNGTGSGEMLYLLDMEFTLEELMPELDLMDHRNNTVEYEYSYYDYLTNSQRTDLFTIQCSDYYLVGSQSSNNTTQVTYWQDNDNYWNAWVDQYNQTIANMLQQASSVSDVRWACDENYNPGFGHIHLIDLPIPSGMAINSLSYLRLAFQPTWQVWCSVSSNGWDGGHHYTYEGLNISASNLCRYDWDSDGDNEYWYNEEFSVLGGTEWGLHSYTNLPPWVGGDSVTELPIYVYGLTAGIQYRVILYFEMVSIVNFEE